MTFTPLPPAGVPFAPGAKPARVKLRRRRGLLAQDAADLDAAFPEPGEACHTLMSGKYDLVQVIDRVARRLAPLTSIRIATLSLNQSCLTGLLELVDGSQTARLDLIVSYYFTTAEKPTYNRILTEFAARPNCRVAAPRCHAKVTLLDCRPHAPPLVLEGSANLRTNKNFEQLTLIRDDTTHDWHAAWMETVMGRYAVRPASDESRTPQAG